MSIIPAPELLAKASAISQAFSYQALIKSPDAKNGTPLHRAGNASTQLLIAKSILDNLVLSAQEQILVEKIIVNAVRIIQSYDINAT